jgi:uncharacterized protein (DUF1778 family)
MWRDGSLFKMNPASPSSLGTIAAHERTTLKAEDYAAFFDALDNPPHPTAALRKAFARHERAVVKK